MIKHYLTIAFRNLRKYGSQTLISIVGLAAGFTCFALASLWIRYEMTYDNFHRDADRIYCVMAPGLSLDRAATRMAPYPLAGYLKATFPEIEDAMALVPSQPDSKVEIGEVEYPADMISVDSSFFRMFDVQIVEGSRDFLTPDSWKLAITQSKARQLFGSESPLGKTVNWFGEHTICAVVTDLPKRSTYAYDFLRPFYASAMHPATQWYGSNGENILVKLAAGTDVKAFRQKLYEHEVRKVESWPIQEMTLVPLTQLRYTGTDIPRDVKFRHILIFALAGALLIFCTLFNYLTLFVNRFRIRQREMALRTVFGASQRSNFTLLAVEIVLTLLAAFVLGLALIHAFHAPFFQLSNIRMSLSTAFGESSVYIGAVMALVMLISWLLLAVFRRKTVYAAIRRTRADRFRKLSVVVQLFISIGFAFCTIVILKQMYHLHNTDLGFAYKDRGSLRILGKNDLKVLENCMGEIAEIEEAFPAYQSLLPMDGFLLNANISAWDGKAESDETISLGKISASEQILSYYGIRLAAGEMLRDSDADKQVLINEAAAKRFGWDQPVGKTFHNEYTVKGVVKDISNLSPTMPPSPYFFVLPREFAPAGWEWMTPSTLLFRYQPGTWKACRAKIEAMIKEVYPEVSTSSVRMTRAEDAYDNYLKSENALLKLLGFTSAICMLVCVFGFVSIVSLSCEERRKEIAIRKVNGATMHDILAMFFKTYFLLLVTGAVIAFPVGYAIMRRWMEQYVMQTGIDAWIYLSILSALAGIITVCVGWRVYRASIENPAEVIKSN